MLKELQTQKYPTHEAAPAFREILSQKRSRQRQEEYYVKKNRDLWEVARKAHDPTELEAAMGRDANLDKLNQDGKALIWDAFAAMQSRSRLQQLVRTHTLA